MEGRCVCLACSTTFSTHEPVTSKGLQTINIRNLHETEELSRCDHAQIGVPR